MPAFAAIPIDAANVSQPSQRVAKGEPIKSQNLLTFEIFFNIIVGCSGENRSYLVYLTTNNFSHVLAG